ncbi:MAG: carbohydrate binding domain-containing protein [Planctomycetota bacterium]
MKTYYFSILFFLSILICSICSADMVPFVIPAQQDANSLIAVQNEPIGADAFYNRIAATGDHFTRGGQRIKFWGVNFSFGGNFPSHADAEVSAERLASAGINSVRCHHTDTLNYPSGIWNPTNGQTIYPEALDRLDYYINELAERGIYINLNLHIGRAHSQYLGLPTPNTDYDKIVGIFTPALINAQKSYAQQMLDHVNPYRGIRVADDPAIAFVEITNEDSFFMWDGPEKLRTLPTYYADILQQQYNDWLGDEYGDTNGLRDVWNANVEPLGENVLTSFVDNFINPNIDPNDKWYLEEHEGCDANFELGTYQSQTGAKLTINITDDSGWHLQIRQSNLQIVEGQFYTLSFEAAAEQPRSISLNVMQHHDPWSGLGLYGTANLTTDWQTFTYTFTATADDDNGRVTFSFGGGDTTTFYLRNPQLRTGGQTGLMEDEFIETGTVRLFVDTAVEERRIDELRFLAETEKAYFDDMRSYIKNDLGCDALVTGTIVFGPLGLYTQSDMDFIDGHSYWQHPRFPGTPWDPANWYIEQKPMTDYINEATLFGLAGDRLGKSDSYAGKPFTVTEYNHSAPLDSQAECVPMMASFAAAQDWDGIWLYAYTHSRDDWNDNFLNGFFDILHNPAKWGFVRAGASIFRYDGIGPVGNTYSHIGLTDPCDPLPALATLYMTYNSDMFGVLTRDSGIIRADLLNNRIVNTLFDTNVIDSQNYSDKTMLDWQIDGNGKGIYTAIGDSARVYVGHKENFTTASSGIIEVNEPNYAAITITTLEPDYTKILLPQKRKFLITACGRSENTGMIFSPDRTTVGTNWGYAPVLIEPVQATIKFPYKGLTCYALSPDGTISYTVPTRIENEQTIIEISPTYETMWYLVTVSGDLNGDGNVSFEDFCKLAQYWLQEELSVDIAPLPYGDGITDYKDLAVFTDTWLLDLNP